MSNPNPSGPQTGENAVRHSSSREWYESLLVAGVFVLFVRTFVVQTYQVPTGSMERTILVGDHFLVNKFAFSPHGQTLAGMLPYREIRRGDIIIFKKPGDDINPGNVLVKRAVGLPTDVLEVHSGALSVNGAPADGPWVQHMPHDYNPHDPRDEFGPFQVPPRDYFGMGDNRDNSLDSRFWGPIPRENVFGRLSLLYWSYEAEPNAHIWRGAVDKIRQLLGVAIHFFTRTRWDRMFRIVR
jgi:signal peptidase I